MSITVGDRVKLRSGHTAIVTSKYINGFFIDLYTVEPKLTSEQITDEVGNNEDHHLFLSYNEVVINEG